MTKISMTALFIFMIIAISSCNNRVSAGTATYGSNLVKVSINTGNYPQEIRWAIYKIDNMDFATLYQLVYYTIECQDTADDLQEKVTGKRRASKRKFMDEFDSEAEKGREMHDTHSAIQAHHQQMMKIRFIVPQGVRPGQKILVNSTI